jgi:hypothetical protein
MYPRGSDSVVPMDRVLKKEESFESNDLELSSFHAYANEFANSGSVGNVSDKVL